MISVWMGATGPRLGIGAAIEYFGDRRSRVEIYLEPRDVWVGVFVAPVKSGQRGAIYICPLPCLVIRISRGRSIVS